MNLAEYSNILSTNSSKNDFIEAKNIIFDS